MNIQPSTKFGYWEVILPRQGKRGIFTLCKCTGCCQVEKLVRTEVLRNGKSQSCGCQRSKRNSETKNQNYNIQIGDMCGFWKVIEKLPGNFCKVKCTACNQTEKLVEKYAIAKQLTKSCGCKRNYLDKQSKIKNKQFLEIGTTLGNWKLINIDDLQYQWLCLSCNNQTRTLSLAEVKTRKTCGCDGKALEVGQKIGYLEVLEYKPRKTKCKCICGKTIHASNILLRKQKVNSCGCKTSELALKTKIKRGYILLDKDGTQLREIVKKAGIENLSHPYRIYHNYGIEHFKQYCENYQGPRIFSTESAFQQLFENDKIFDVKKYDKQPKEFKINRRPDFRLENNNKVLYINIDGLFDHSEKGRRKLDKKYHSDLLSNFIKNNQIIFQFREDELRDKPEVVKSIILNYFNIHSQEYYGRKTKIKKIDNNTKDDFLNKNHLMGPDKCSTGFGLYYQNNLVSIISVKNIKDKIEISRFCNKINTKVIGGLSKLLKHVVNLYNPNSIQSFVDLRYATGNSYKILGFEQSTKTLSWKWTNGFSTYNRLSCRANIDERKLTEKQYAEEKGLYKIYDAGQLKFVKNLNLTNIKGGF